MGLNLSLWAQIRFFVFTAHANRAPSVSALLLPNTHRRTQAVFSTRISVADLRLKLSPVKGHTNFLGSLPPFVNECGSRESAFLKFLLLHSRPSLQRKKGMPIKRRFERPLNFNFRSSLTLLYTLIYRKIPI